MNIIKGRHKDKSNRRFASREDIIRHTMEREREEYNSAGIGKFIKEVKFFVLETIHLFFVNKQVI